MFDRFVEFAAEAQPEEVRALSVEDMAVCVAWYQSYANDPAKQAVCQGLQEATERWLAEMEPLDHKSEGSRQQPLLRGLVDKLQDRPPEAFQRDELDFLCICYDLMQRADRPDFFARPLGLLGPHVDKLQGRREALRVAPGLPALAARVTFLVGKELEAAPAREVRLLAGIELPSRGPVYTHAGDVKVVDYVPENCTLVVEQGACYVGGFVLGRVLATGQCEVRENISGVAIVTQGDIRVRNIINKALVVAKLGQVRCRSVQDPNLVFAGEGIWVAESATMGCYIAPRIEVVEEVMGGELHISERLSARCFRPSLTHELSIVLRRELSCEDYGEELRLEARQLIARRARLKGRLRGLEQIVGLVEEESDHCALSALMFLCGGDRTKELLEEIQAARHRLAFLERIITGLRTLSGTAQSNLALVEGPRPGGAEELLRPVSTSSSSIQEVELELKAVESEGAVDKELARERDEMLAIGKTLTNEASNRAVTSMSLDRLQQKESTWVAERQDLVATVEAKQRGLRRLLGHMDLLEQAGAAASKVQVLQRLVALAKERPPNDPLAVRFKAGFVRVMLRTIQTRLDRARRYKHLAEDVRAELRDVQRQLRQDYQVAFEDEDAPPVLPHVVGTFDAGVRVCAGRYMLHGLDAPPGSVVVTSDSHGRTVTFVREGHRVVGEE